MRAERETQRDRCRCAFPRALWMCLDCICEAAIRPLNGSGNSSGTVNVVSCVNIENQETYHNRCDNSDGSGLFLDGISHDKFGANTAPQD